MSLIINKEWAAEDILCQTIKSVAFGKEYLPALVYSKRHL